MANLTRQVCPKDGRSDSLSLRERVGVRGNSAHSNPDLPIVPIAMAAYALPERRRGFLTQL